MTTLLAPPALFQIAPPYDQFEALPELAGHAPPALPDAAVLAVAVSSPEPWDDLADRVARLRTSCPAAPVVLRVGDRADGRGDDWARHAALVGARGVLFEGEPTRPRLRRILTDATALPAQVDDWLALRVPSLPAAVQHLIHAIVEAAPRFGEVAALLASIGHAERTARTWFHAAGVPGPGKWLAAAHAVRAALRLQAEPAPLLALAVECGYSDHSSLSRQSLRLFGVRPGAIRRTLGWEWLLDRWLRRAAV